MPQPPCPPAGSACTGSPGTRQARWANPATAAPWTCCPGRALPAWHLGIAPAQRPCAARALGHRGRGIYLCGVTLATDTHQAAATQGGWRRRLYGPGAALDCRRARAAMPICRCWMYLEKRQNDLDSGCAPMQRPYHVACTPPDLAEHPMSTSTSNARVQRHRDRVAPGRAAGTAVGARYPPVDFAQECRRQSLLQFGLWPTRPDADAGAADGCRPGRCGRLDGLMRGDLVTIALQGRFWQTPARARHPEGRFV